MSKYLAVLLAGCLSACGMKGSLELPPGPAPEPILGKRATKAPAGSPAKDVSTDKNRSSE